MVKADYVTGWGPSSMEYVANAAALVICLILASLPRLQESSDADIVAPIMFNPPEV